MDRLLDLKPTDVEGSHLRAAIAVTARDKLLVFLACRDVAATNDESEQALLIWCCISYEVLEKKCPSS